MTKLEELKAAYEAEPYGLSPADEDGMEPRLIAFYHAAHNLMPQLLEAVERVEAFQSVCSELTGMNPFLAGEFYKNKTVLEKLK